MSRSFRLAASAARDTQSHPRSPQVLSPIVTLALLGSLATGCLATASPAATRPSASAVPQSDPTPRTASLTPERVRNCAGFPSRLVATVEDAPRVQPSNVVTALSLASESHPGQELIAVVLYQGPSTYAGIFPPAIPHAPPQPVRLASGRQVLLEGRDFFLGGAVVWGTLTSPHREYDLTAVLDEVPPDTGIDRNDLEALRRLEPVKLVECLDAGLW